jgi:periplasmic protein TonB
MLKRVVIGLCLAVLLAAGVRAQQSQEQTVHRPGKDVTAPRLIKEVKPRYTPDAMERKVSGLVGLSCVVETDGTPGDIQVTKQLDPDLDQAAIDALKEWRFAPGQKDGKPVRVAIDVEMTFTLKR